MVFNISNNNTLLQSVGDKYKRMHQMADSKRSPFNISKSQGSVPNSFVNKSQFSKMYSSIIPNNNASYSTSKGNHTSNMNTFVKKSGSSPFRSVTGTNNTNHMNNTGLQNITRSFSTSSSKSQKSIFGRNVMRGNGVASTLAASSFFLAMNNTKEGSFFKTVYAEEKRIVDVRKKRKLRRIFNKFATNQDEQGNQLMTPEDFIRSITELDSPAESRKTEIPTKKEFNTLDMLFKMADTNKTGNINFSEFIILFKMITTPENEMELTFQMLDSDKNGSISKEEFMKAMKSTDNLNVEFDFNCDLMSRFFGRDGRSELSFIQFTHFMKMLQEEIRRQEFFALDKDNDGYISVTDFANIIRSYANSGRVSDRIKTNVERLNKSVKDSKISYAEFDALNRILSNSQAISAALRSVPHEQDGSISKFSFSRAAKMTTGISLSPLEVDIIFRMFSTAENQNKLNTSDYEDFIETMKDAQDSKKKELNLWLKDRISPEGKERSALTSIVHKVTEFAIRVLYAGTAGAIGATVVYPIDLVKTRMQNQRKVVAGDTSQVIYKSSMDCFKQIIKHEGPKGLYSGLGPQLAGVAPEKAIKLVVNDLLRDLFSDYNSEGQMYLPLEILSGMGAGASQVVFTNPIEIVKIRLQTQGEYARTTGQQPKSAIAICKELGFKGLYRGASACFARDIPFSGIYFPLYAKFKESFRDEEKDDTSATGLLLAGSIAGAIAASSTTPIDVVKTRLQVETRAGQETYNGMFDCFKKIYKSEGPKAFFKGVVPRTCRSSPQFGVTLLSYEALQKYVSPKKSKSEEKEAKKRLAVGPRIEDEELYALREIATQKLHNFSRIFGKVSN